MTDDQLLSILGRLDRLESATTRDIESLAAEVARVTRVAENERAAHARTVLELHEARRRTQEQVAIAVAVERERIAQWHDAKARTQGAVRGRGAAEPHEDSAREIRAGRAVP